MTDIHNTLIQRAADVRSEFGRGRTETEDSYFLGLAHGLEEAASLYLRKRVDEYAA